MDEMRKQLDALMGTDRNGDIAGKKSFTDPEICKYYLAGLCPHDLFINTVCIIFLFHLFVGFVGVFVVCLLCVCGLFVVYLCV
jgi:hypothetical protein